MMKRISFVVGVVCVFVIANFGLLNAQEKGGTSKEKRAKTERVDKEKSAALKKAGKATEKAKEAPKKPASKSEKEKPKGTTKEKPAVPIKEIVEEIKRRKVVEKPKHVERGEKPKLGRETAEGKAKAEQNEDAVYESMLNELTDIVAKQERDRIAESEKRIEEVKERLGKHLKLIQQRHAEKEAEYQRTIEAFRADLLDLNRRIEQLIEKYTPVKEQPKPKKSAAPPSGMKERDIAAAKEELFKAGMEYYFRAADVYIPMKPFIETFFDEKGVSISVYDSRYKEEATAQVNLSYDENKNIVVLVSKGEDFAGGKWKEIPPRKK